jgi:hypothetical protein
MLLSLVTLQVGVTSVLVVSMKHVTDNYRSSLRCDLWLLEYKQLSSIKYWYFWKYNLEVMLQYSSYFYFYISSSCVSDIHVFFSFLFLYPRHGSVCSIIKVMLPNITLLLHSYSPVQNPHAQSNTDKLAMCHSYPQCHKTATAECHIIPSPPLLSLSDRYFLCSPAQFFIHSSFVTSHWRSVLLTVPSSSSNKQTNSTQYNTQYHKPHFTSLLPI